MKPQIFLLFSLILFHQGSSQVTFEKNYYLDGYEPYNISPAIINTIDSGYYIVSFSGDTNVSNNFFISISRLNKLGEVIWNKNSDPYTLHSDYGLGEVVQYPDSSLVMLWNNINSTHFDNKTGFIHIDKNGNAIWAKRYTCPLNRGYVYMNSFTKTNDNGLIGWGNFEALPSGLDFRFLLKTDSAGNIKWCKQYYPDSAIFGNTSLAARITQTPDSGFLFNFDAEDSITLIGYGYIVKTDNNGNVEWAKRFNQNAGGPEFTKPQVYNGTIILPFLYSTFSNIEILKIDMNGIPFESFEYTGSDMSNFYDGVTDHNGNTFLSGLTKDTLGFIFKIDSSGNVLWSFKYGKTDSCLLSNLLLTIDGGVLGYGWGSFYNNNTESQSLISLVKLDYWGQDGCEQLFPIIKTDLPLVYTDVIVKDYPVAMTQLDTVLNFHNVSMGLTTLCSVKNTTLANTIKNNVDVEIYPNPASTFLNIKTSSLSSKYFYLYDGLGKLVQNAELKSDFTTISLTQLANGIYYYRIVDDEQKEIKTDKLLIIR